MENECTTDEISLFFDYIRTLFSVENLKTISWYETLLASNSYLDSSSNVNESFNAQICSQKCFLEIQYVMFLPFSLKFA